MIVIGFSFHIILHRKSVIHRIKRVDPSGDIHLMLCPCPTRGVITYNIRKLGAPVTDSPNDGAYDCADQWNEDQPWRQTLFGMHVATLGEIDD
jgi:hypothetical protein